MFVVLSNISGVVSSGSYGTAAPLEPGRHSKPASATRTISQRKTKAYKGRDQQRRCQERARWG